MSIPASGAGPSRATVAFIFMTVALDMLALGIVIPVLPPLVVRFMNGDVAGGAEVWGVFGTAWALMQFIASPVLGALSDRFGRRPVILLSNFGLGLDYVLMALAPSLAWLFVGRLISGATAASVSTAYAYIADGTPLERRSAAYGVLGAAFGLGFVLGPAIGGLLGSLDPRMPFWAAAGASLLNALYGFFILPESLPAERRTPFQARKANPVGSLALLRSSPSLTGLAAATFLSQLAHVALPTVSVLYAGYRYGWDERQVGFLLAAVGLASMIVQGALTGPVVKRLGERRAMLCGLAAGAAGFAIYGLAETGPVFWIGVPVMAFWGIAGAAGQTLMTARVPPTEQGKLQGALSSLQGIAGLIGPGLFTFAFASFIAPDAAWHLPGISFLLAASMLVASGTVVAKATRTNR